jgi:hypothetical protein
MIRAFGAHCHYEALDQKNDKSRIYAIIFASSAVNLLDSAQEQSLRVHSASTSMQREQQLPEDE